MGGRKSDKRYTNEAWTKRVDHEAGGHRTRRASAEPLVCYDFSHENKLAHVYWRRD